jgi:hypothetical protein
MRQQPRTRPRAGLDTAQAHRLSTQSRRQLQFYILCGAGIAGLFVAASGAASAPIRWLIVLIGAAVTVGSWWSALERRHTVGRRGQQIAAAVGVGFCVLLGAGLITQDIVDGRPIREGSAEDVAREQVTEVRAGLTELSALDDLLILDDGAARAQIRDLERGRDDAARLLADWAKGRDDWSNIELAGAANDLEDAANSAFLAFEAKIALTEVDDNELAEEFAQNRQRFVTSVLSAGAQLQAGAARAGIDPGAVIGAAE